MEWNHFWPQSIFGDWPVGQWLTKKQHAIASALQTLVFKENCMCAWHKKYLSPKLIELAWPYYRSSARERLKRIHSKKDENGKSLRALKLHEKKDENGKSLHSKKIHTRKDENGKSLLGLKCSAIIHEKKDENGKSLTAVKGGRKVVDSGAIQKTHQACRKPVLVTSEEGETLYFPSIKETGEYFSVKQNVIGAFIASGKFIKRGKCKGYRFDLIKEM